VPHISTLGRNELHTRGRVGKPNSSQRPSAVNCTHRTPAGLPMPPAYAIPGIGLDIDGAVQHAPHPGRHGGDASVANDAASIEVCRGNVTGCDPYNLKLLK
jgi:hypothetical protein